ncbi:7670_t:CDS:1 [Ambispora leptoticha]|uniref:7670_t:CDS:1 n=1 Tax=Ambispora leptoticha TaxID=144679 RepID=A0A9N9ACZ3_9GLOM|nr:7670_t:CDS:1 [Ambispora leptoticha]
MHTQASKNTALKIFDVPGLLTIDDEAIKQTLEAFDECSLLTTGDKITDGLIEKITAERKVIRDLFDKGAEISKLSANLSKKIIQCIKSFSATGFENKTGEAFVNAATRIADESQDLAKEFEATIQRLKGIINESTKHSRDNESQKATLETEGEKLNKTVNRLGKASIFLGVAALVTAPLTIGVSLIVTGATVATFTTKKYKEKKVNEKIQEFEDAEIRSIVLKSLIENMGISLYNVKQFENVWRNLASEAKLRKEDSQFELDSIEEYGVVSEVTTNDLKLKWEKMYQTFESYAESVQSKLDNTV